MEDGVDNDRCVRRLVEDLARKPANGTPAEVVQSNRIDERMTLNPLHASFHTAQKFFTEAQLATLLLPVGSRNVFGSLRRVEDLINLGSAGLLLYLLPRAARGGVRKELLFAPPQLLAFFGGRLQRGLLASDAVPEVFDQLEALGHTQFKERSKFSAHS